MPDLPTHCLWCGAYLRGGLTEHAIDCWLRTMQVEAARVFAIPPELLGVSPIETLRRAIAAECECRTCGHPASAHIGGHCFECGRERCWS